MQTRRQQIESAWAVLFRSTERVALGYQIGIAAVVGIAAGLIVGACFFNLF